MISGNNIQYLVIENTFLCYEQGISNITILQAKSSKEFISVMIKKLIASGPAIGMRNLATSIVECLRRDRKMKIKQNIAKFY